MLIQLAKILKEKYPDLLVEYSHTFNCVIMYRVNEDHYRLILEIYEDGMKNGNDITLLTPADPDYFQILDEQLEKSLSGMVI